jgi:hypothetical protein
MPATWIEETCFVGYGQGDAGAARWPETDQVEIHEPLRILQQIAD